ADEAALKLREATQSWTEAYYAMEYRHGPIAIAEPGRVVSVFGPAPEGLSAQVEATGATWHAPGLDPLAQLVGAHLWAVRRVVTAPLPADAASASAAAPRRAIGIDVGGTRTKIGLVAADGSLGIPYSLPTPADPRELCAMLARETSSLRERAGLPAKTPIGAVVPGILDEERELVELAVNLGWKDLSLGAMLREHLTAPLALGHDVRAGGMAEAAW